MSNFLNLVLGEDKTIDNFLNRVKEHETVRGFMDLQNKNKAVRIFANILLLVVYAFVAVLVHTLFFESVDEAIGIMYHARSNYSLANFRWTFLCAFAAFCSGRFFYRRRWFLIAALILLLIVSGSIIWTVFSLILVTIIGCIGLYFYRQAWIWIVPMSFAPALMLLFIGDGLTSVVQLPFAVVFWSLYALVIYGVYRVDARMSLSTNMIKLVQQGKRDLVAASLQRGANANVTDDTGTPVLVHALGDMGMFKLLLEHGADASAAINFANANGKPTLAQALGEMEVFRLLLEHGADVNAADETGKTALMRAVEMKNMEAVKLLLEKGADINAADAHGQTPLVSAMKAKNVKAASLLLELGASLDVAKDGGELLALAAQNNDMELARRLVAMGVNPQAASQGA